MLQNQNFLSIKQFQMMNFQLILTRMISSWALITFATKQLNKMIYTLFNLALVQYLFLILYSNSYCESTFSTTEILGKDTTNGVYTETLSIRNYLLGILIPKINIFGQLACYEWEKRKCILCSNKICNIKRPSIQEKLTTTSSN